MKAVIQRVESASVGVGGNEIAHIGRGILTLLGVSRGDTEEKAQKLIERICNLRIFPDADGKMNLSIKDISGQHLIVSQFTLAADTGSGRRPSFTEAESPQIAEKLYEFAVKVSREQGIVTATGRFQAEMKVSLVNDGPVTFLLEC